MTVTEKPDLWTFDFNAEEVLKKYDEEREKRMRRDHQQQYITIGEGKGAKYASWLTDIWTPKPAERAPMNIETAVIILGAGFSGIQMGARLKQRGQNNFKIVDKAGDFGGTWYWNRYPGAACDSESYCYLPLLEEMGYMPSHHYAIGPEIRQHCIRMATHFGLHEHAIFNTGLKEFRWDDDDKVWRGTTDQGDTITTRFLVTCGGPINHPHLPDVEGIDTFEGHEFHTARWDYAYTGGNSDGDYDMKGLNDKTVAIIGTGATAIQCVPFLGASCKKLIVFQRTPSAVDVRDNKPTDPAWWKSLPKGWQAKRDWNFQLGSGGPLMWAVMGKPTEELEDGFSRSSRGYWELVQRQMETGEGKQYDLMTLLQLADIRWMNRIRARCDEVVKDKRTAELLKPYFNLWCKRPVYSDTYLQTFNLPNVELVDTSVTKGITKITPKGIVIGDKEYQVDVIIWSTGYSLPAGETHHDYKILGRGGLTWTEKQKLNDGYASHYGIATHGFPNYLQFGHRQGAVSVNFTSIYNDQALWCSYVIDQAIKRGARTIEVTREAEEEWTKEVLSKERPRSKFLETCTPGYYNAEGDIEKLLANRRAQAYGGGALLYRKYLMDYIKSGELAGFEVRV